MSSTTKYPEIFAALARPFPGNELKQRPGGKGKSLVYITARTAMKRLDEVLGPENWTDRYYEVCEVLFCEITITLPDGTRVAKSDAGGFRKMGDDEDSAKTGPSDAFKRASAKFGIARDLYNDGSVDFGEPKAEPAQVEQAPAGRTFLDFAKNEVDAANVWWKRAGWPTPLCANEWQLMMHLAKHFRLFTQGTTVKRPDILRELNAFSDTAAVKAETERYLYTELKERAEAEAEAAMDRSEAEGSPR